LLADSGPRGCGGFAGITPASLYIVRHFSVSIDRAPPSSRSMQMRQRNEPAYGQSRADLLSRLPALGNLPVIPLFQRAMNKIVVRGATLLGILLALGSLQGCFGLQHAAGCNSPGVFGCKDTGPEPPEITQPPTDLKRAPPGGRAQQAPVGVGSYLEGHEYPWSRPLDDCMAAGGTRTECSARLPPDILEQFEAWEAERAAQRRRQLQQRSRERTFGVESVCPRARD